MRQATRTPRRMVLSSHGRYNTALCGGRLIWLLVKIYIPDSMSTSWAASLAVASLFALSGCTPLKVKLGWKVPGQDSHLVHPGQPAERPGNRARREVARGRGSNRAGRQGIDDRRARPGKGYVE